MMPAPVSLAPVLVMIAARQWLSTPFTPGAACRGAGADCAGLIRGVLGDLTGHYRPAPPYDREGGSWAAAMAQAAQAAGFSRRDARADPRPGDVVAWSIGGRAHVGIATDRGVIHADTWRGVIEVPAAPAARRIAAWAIPAPIGCTTGPADLTRDDLLACIWPDGANVLAEITDQRTAAPLLRRRFTGAGAAIDFLEAWSIQVEVA